MVKAKRVTLRTVNAAWRAREEFDCNGTLTGEYTLWPSSGRLNESEAERLASDSAWAREIGARLYVVRSYYTPIAWVVINDCGEVVHKVAQRFSVTTTRHAGTLY